MSLLEQLFEIKDYPTNSKCFIDVMKEFVINDKYYNVGKYEYSDDIIDLRFIVKLTYWDDLYYIIGYIANISTMVVVINWLEDDSNIYHYVFPREAYNFDEIVHMDVSVISKLEILSSRFPEMNSDDILVGQFLPRMVKSARNS